MKLARWLFFANRGEFRTGDSEEIMNKASCLSLLSNAVLVWNTIKIGNIVGQLRAAGEQIDDADLSAHSWSVSAGTDRRYSQSCIVSKMLPTASFYPVFSDRPVATSEFRLNRDARSSYPRGSGSRELLPAANRSLTW